MTKELEAKEETYMYLDQQFLEQILSSNLLLEEFLHEQHQRFILVLLVDHKLHHKSILIEWHIKVAATYL